MPQQLGNELLPCGLARIEEPQAGEQPALCRRVRLQLCLLVHVHHHRAQVSSAAALASFKERLCDIVKDVNGGGPVLGLDVTRGGDAGLLLRFVVVAVRDLLL